jgi:hypothetical protein
LPNVQGQIAKILANASTPDFSGASDINLGYALSICVFNPKALIFHQQRFGIYKNLLPT